MKDNLCFTCKQPGHTRRDCPQNPSNQRPTTNVTEGKGGKKKSGYNKRGGRNNKRKGENNNNNEERDAKKPRTEGEGEAKRETQTRAPNPDSNRDKTPKRKIVLLIGYCGKNYIGLQR